MPITIYPSTLKYKNSNGVFQSADAIKGDKGDTYTLTAADKTDIAASVDYGSFIQEVSGTAVTITGEPGIRYVCGEVTTISITPPASGTIIVRFTSGSTPATLALPSTVIMPEWWTDTEANYTYELCISF